MGRNISKYGTAQNDTSSVAYQLEQLRIDPAYLQILKKMQDVISLEVPKYGLINGRLARVEDEWVKERIANLNLMLNNYIEHNYPLLKIVSGKVN